MNVLKLTILFCNILLAASWVEKTGPRYPPTKGEIWPKPQVENKMPNYYTFNPSKIDFNVTQNTCVTLDKALKRSFYLLDKLYKVVTTYGSQSASRDNLVSSEGGIKEEEDELYSGVLDKLKVVLTKPCEDYPHFDMDEAYNLTINKDPILQSDSIWGIIRGLESFVQLFYVTYDYKEMRINATAIIDYPRYSHRGILLDTSRHYISVKKIQQTLDAMAMNKMNVFHWHIVDDQSFPYVSDEFPELSGKGAFHETMVYTALDVSNIVEYARLRGIRVLPEFDVPGHTTSWGASHPELLTECYSVTEGFIGLGPMNPVRNFTYEFLHQLLQEVQQRFPDKYFHLGGDEVALDCWCSNLEIINYMKRHSLESASQLHAIFMERSIPLLAKGTIPILWQEVFDENVPLPLNTLIQVWKGTPMQAVLEMKKVLNAGYKVIFSEAWYLDHLSSDGDWTKYYDFDPKHELHNDTLARGVVGGEACMWGEVVDNNNVISRVWPRASAVAERLWSPYILTPDHTNSERVFNRLEEHTCRMIRSGIPAQPASGPGFCLAASEEDTNRAAR